MVARGNTPLLISKKKKPTIHFPKYTESECTRDRTLRSRGNEEQGKAYLHTLFPFPNQCLNQLLQQRADSHILWKWDGEKYVLYFESGNVSLKKYLSNFLVEKETITFKFCQLKRGKKRYVYCLHFILF